MCKKKIWAENLNSFLSWKKSSLKLWKTKWTTIQMEICQLSVFVPFLCLLLFGQTTMVRIHAFCRKTDYVTNTLFSCFDSRLYSDKEGLTQILLRHPTQVPSYHSYMDWVSINFTIRLNIILNLFFINLLMQVKAAMRWRVEVPTGPKK